nr:DUF192 domain-containing protein [uncultured Ruegeria sp.]
MIRFLSVLIILSVMWAETALAACREDRIYVRNDKTHIRFDIELAISPQDRARGLMFRESLPTQSGMLFVFDPPQPVAFWMKNTLIPLDMIFLDQSGSVMKVHHNAVPGDLTPVDGGGKVFAVLEINAGLAARYLITPGSQMRHKVFSRGPAIWPC